MTTKSKPLLDFSLSEYRKHIVSGDLQYLSDLTKKYKLNKGKGFSQTYVHSVVNELSRDNGKKFENKEIENMFKSLIKVRLINEFYGEQKRKDNIEFGEYVNMIKDTHDATWAVIINHFRKK